MFSLRVRNSLAAHRVMSTNHEIEQGVLLIQPSEASGIVTVQAWQISLVLCS